MIRDQLLKVKSIPMLLLLIWSNSTVRSKVAIRMPKDIWCGLIPEFSLFECCYLGIRFCRYSSRFTRVYLTVQEELVPFRHPYTKSVFLLNICHKIQSS